MKTTLRNGLLWTPPQTATVAYKLFSWGYNRFGELGQGTNSPAVYYTSSPVQVGALTSWTRISAGWNAITSQQVNGKVFVWGENQYGTLGTGNRTYYSSPVQLGALTTWTKTATGTNRGNSSGIIGGKLYVWGRNNTGALGNGTTTPAAVSSPVQVGARTDWTDCDSMSESMLGICNNGRLYAWGENDWGQLGFGPTTAPGYPHPSPIQVGARTTWSRLFRGLNLTRLALQTDKSLWAWGQNSGGICGQGFSTPYITSPVQVGAGKLWAEVAIGQYHVLGITTDGKLWAWGDGANGALGQGNTASLYTPTQVGVATNWIKVGAGQSWSAAVNSLGKLYTWGKNKYGRLGLGDLLDRSSPVQVGALTTWRNVFCAIYTGFGLTI